MYRTYSDLCVSIDGGNTVLKGKNDKHSGKPKSIKFSSETIFIENKFQKGIIPGFNDEYRIYSDGKDVVIQKKK